MMLQTQCQESDKRLRMQDTKIGSTITAKRWMNMETYWTTSERSSKTLS